MPPTESHYPFAFPEVLQGHMDELALALASAAAPQVLLVIDTRVLDAWAEALQPLTQRYPYAPVVAHEDHKTLAAAEAMYHACAQAGLERGGLIVAIGGGLTTDVAAFVASTWKRGVRLWLVPTTLLAAADATLGGKTGLNFGHSKNQVGTFYPAERIYVSPNWFSTLPPEARRSGLAELLKHGLIADHTHWEELTTLGSTYPTWPQLERSLHIKAQIVADDPTERGPRKLLNYGHTLGHALESARLAAGAPLAHGLAVAVGLTLEARLSVTHAGLPQADAQHIETCLVALGYDLSLGDVSDEALRLLAHHDKKNTQGELRFTLLSAVGAGVYDVPVVWPAVQAVLSDHRTQHG